MPILPVAYSADSQNWPSGTTLIALLPLLVLVLGFEIYCLIDLIRAPSVKQLPKVAWALIIVLGSAPIGAIIYLLVGRDRNHSVSDGAANGFTATTPPGPRTVVADARPAPPGLVLRTVGLTRDYGRGSGLFDVDLAVPRGSVYGLVGPNGAGKTTLLSIVTGMRRADRGEVQLGLPRASVAVCPDVPEFDGWLTAAEVVALAAALVAGERHRRDGGALDGGPLDRAPNDGDAVRRALRTAGLHEVADRRVGGFSRGMTQRLGLACALVANPELLILDEPTSALDPAGRAEMLDLVAALRGQRTVIFSSHILADVQRVADHVGILRGGRLIYQGSTRQLIDDHLQPRWLLRVAGDPTAVFEQLSRSDWVTRLEPAAPDTIRLEATSIAAGERGIPVVLASCGARLVSCEPLAADLESAFLALTGSEVMAR